MLINEKRKKNEKEFSFWENTPAHGRRYWFDVAGRNGWKARYIKEVNEKEETISFWQEIYNNQEELVEVHYKYPIDKGHVKIK